MHNTTKFAALSYCWGSGREDLLRAATKRCNVDAYTDEIPFAILPKTLRDAVVATFSLGMQYLWVDSLCIVQDNQEEKAADISAMTDVYGFAHLTIVASAAAAATEGFLLERSQARASPRFRIPYALSPRTESYDASHPIKIAEAAMREADVQSSVILQPAQLLDRGGGGERHSQLPEEDVLYTRGWAMQEFLLSSRLLDIGTLQTRWSCRHDRIGQCDGWVTGPTHKATPYRYETTPMLRYDDESPVFDTALDAILSAAAVSTLRSSDTLMIWGSLVTSFTSSRHLTVSSDRILAISGIAERISRSMPGSYAAGMWEHGLPESLEWVCAEADKTCYSRPREYQGPSWSWTSFTGPVNCEWGSFSDLLNELGPLQTELLSVDVEPVYSEAPFGAVKEGSSITVKGRVASVRRLCEDVTSYHTDCKAELLRDDGSLTVVDIRQDLDEFVEDGNKGQYARVKLLLLGMGPNYFGWYGPVRTNRAARSRSQLDLGDQRQGYRGLILSKVATGRYRRLGTFYSQGPNSVYQKKGTSYIQWEDCLKETVVLV